MEESGRKLLSFVSKFQFLPPIATHNSVELGSQSTLPVVQLLQVQKKGMKLATNGLNLTCPINPKREQGRSLGQSTE